MADATVEAKTESSSVRKQRPIQIGIVVSNKRQKTITVEVKELIKHAQYKKYTYRSTKFHAHDEKGEAGLGDTVEIQMTRPLSKQKNWRLVRIVTKAD